MKFLTLEQGQLGVLIEQTVVDVPAAARELEVSFTIQSLKELVCAGEETARDAFALAEQALRRQLGCRPYKEVRPGAPIPNPRRNILCLGKNYLEHAREVAENSARDL